MSREILSPLFTNLLGLSSTDVDALYSESVPEELQAKVSKGIKSLTTLEAAKANSEVRNHVMAQTLNGVEDAILGHSKREYADLLGDDVFENLNNEKKTSKKVIALIESLKGAYDGQISALNESIKSKGSKVSEEVQKRMEALENEIRGWKQKETAWNSEKEEMQANFHSTRVQGELMRHLSGLNWKDNDPEMVELFTEKVIKKARGQAGFGFDEKGGLFAHNPEDKSLGVYGEDKTRALSPQELIMHIAKPYLSKNDANRDRSNGRDASLPNFKTRDTSKMNPNQRKAYEHLQKQREALGL